MMTTGRMHPPACRGTATVAEVAAAAEQVGIMRVLAVLYDLYELHWMDGDEHMPEPGRYLRDKLAEAASPVDAVAAIVRDLLERADA